MRRVAVLLGSLSLCMLCHCRQPESRQVQGHPPQAGVSRPEEEPHRSPCEVVIFAEGKYALTANQAANTVSLVDLERGQVIQEVAAGQKPAGLAVSRDGQRAAVANLWSGDVTLYTLEQGKLVRSAQVAAGPFPRGLAFGLDGSTLYVALAGADEIVEISWARRQITRRFPTGREPRQVVVSAEGKHLAAASSLGRQVRLWDLANGKELWQRPVTDGFNLRGLTFTPDGRHLVVAHAVRRDLPVTKHNIEEGWVIDTRLTRLALQAEAKPGSWQVALDLRAQAVADPHGMAFSPSGDLLAITAGGSQELILLEKEGITWNGGDPGDFMDFATEKRTRKIALGGRPMGVAFSPKNHQVVVANFMLDALQVVDLKTEKVRQTISLGGPKKVSPARLGEGLFYDARRSHHQWMSCNTCHTDGHTVSLNFDTLNDDSYGTPKLTPTLHNVSKTAPYTWHGWQKDLGAAVKKSFTETMFGKEPTEGEVKSVVAFLDTLAPPPHPRGKELSPAAQRGQQLFKNKSACIQCHRGPYFTSPNNYDVKIEADGSPFDTWNPPSLIGLYNRGPYLHDGRAKTLDDVLRRNHTPDMIGGQVLTDAERADLIAYLLSL